MRDRLEEFGLALLDPGRPVPMGIVGPDSKVSVRRFAVYRNNVVMSLIDALAAAYPAVRRLVGEEFFRAMARIFVSRRPPVSPIMLRYGEGLAEFIETFPPAASVPYLADVARVEFSWAEAYHAAEAQPLGREDLAGIDPKDFARMHLTLHPSSRLVGSKFPIVTIWQMNLPDGTPGPVDLAQPETALIVRPRAEVEVRRIAQDSAIFLGELIAGQTLAGAAAAVLMVNPRFDLVDNLTEIIRVGLITGWSEPVADATKGRHARRSA